MNTNQKISSSVPTPESVWAFMQENDRRLSEKFAKIAQMQAENERILTEKQAETDRIVKETSKNIDKILGKWGNNLGSFAEEYFFNSFEKGEKNFFGKKFDEITKHLSLFWKGLQDEYDIVMYNDDAVAIIEVKFKAHINDIETVLKKAETFKILSPNHKDFKIFLGLASMSFYPELELACKEKGIAVIKQVGEKVVIIDEGLKAY